MKYKQLGRSGLLVSELCLGTMTFGGKGFWSSMGALGQSSVDQIVKGTYEAGINFIDTADVYSEGESEQLLGQALKNTGIARKDVVIGQTVVTNLFASIDPIGKTIEMNNVPYTVVGVLAAKGGGSTFNDPDNVALAPLSTVQDSLTGFGSLSEIAVQATSAGSTSAAQAEVTSLLLDYLNETASTEQFTVTNESSLLSTAQKNLSALQG